MLNVTKPFDTFAGQTGSNALTTMHPKSPKTDTTKPNPNANATVSDKLLIALQYYQEYRTMEYIAVDYTCSKSSVCRSINGVEKTLSANG